MKQTQEFDGKNIDNAIERACLALNVSKKNLVYDVISSGSTGIFGIVGVKKARIRVTLPEKKDGGASTKSQSYDGDRAGVMSIVDEAFGKEIKPVKEEPVSEAEPSGNSASDIGDISEKRNGSEKRKSLERRKPPEARKPSEGDKNPPEDKPATPRSRRGRSGRKPVNEKQSVEKSLTETEIADKSVIEVATVEKQTTGRPAKGKPATVKPYNRKNRVRKKDTWLRADGDAVLNDAMASADEAAAADRQLPEAKSDPKRDIPKDRGDSDDKNSSLISDSNATDGHKTISAADAVDGDQSGADDTGRYEAESDYEFLEEDFETPAEGDDEPSIDEDQEILELYDERDDGYPPKYKGEIPVDVSEEAMRIGRETLQKMVALITDDATVVAQSDEDRLLLKVEGGNSGVLIGRRGQTLEAMQFLTDKIINRYSESRVRLKVDIEGYMETRKANLRTLAYKMADKAKKTGKPATINQMTAQDRRIVHIALKDDTRVRTQSMGDGYYRRLVIFPKKSSFKRRKPFRK